MLYFDCLLIGAWALAFGWLFGALYVQNNDEERANLRLAESPEAEDCVEIPSDAVTSAAAAD